MDDKSASEENNMTSAKYYTILQYTKGFCQVKKIKQSEKNSAVGVWVKAQLGLFFWKNFVFFVFFVVLFLLNVVPKKI